MLHEKILAEKHRQPVNVAAVWPVSPQIAPLPIPDIVERPLAASEREQPAPHLPTPAADDVPKGVGVLIVAAYCALLASLAAISVASRQSAFAVAIAALFLVAFFTVPRLFLGVEPARRKRPRFDRFLNQGMDTLTGRCSGGAALVQMLIVPVFLTFGILAMGIAVAINL